jgi:glycosyltransferase involved in cell wall biosynthesis
MKVVAVLPAYNAEKTLQKTYQAIPRDQVHEIILVDDASRDETVQKAKAIDHLIVVLHEQNKGYGGNQKTCYSEALQRGADIVIMIHPDFQYDPKHVPEMIKPLREHTADFVIGSRFLHSDPRQFGMDWWRYWGNRLLTTIQNYRLGTNLSECHSGYRAYSRATLEAIPYQHFSDNFVFDSQFLTAAASRRLRITEVPVEASYAAESSSISFPKSIRYGLATLRQLW